MIRVGVAIFCAVLIGGLYGLVDGLRSIYDSCVVENRAAVYIICLSAECWPAIPPSD